MTYEKIPVLMVDDRPENLISLGELLSDLPLQLVRAHSGNEALRHALNADFALVLLDVQMPEMDGFETAELLRGNPKTRHFPIILVTAGLGEERQIFKGYEAGAVDYLLKPIEPEILRSKVKVFSELYRQRRELERMQRELETKHRELGESHLALEERNRKLQEASLKVEEETAQRLLAVEELRQKDQIMLHQGRMAAMGEMLNNIAHQWRQPLNVLGLKIQEIGLFCEFEEFSQELLDNNIAKVMEILKHMSQTIDDFQNFTAPDKEKVGFSGSDVVERALSLVGESFRARGIALVAELASEARMHGYPNEYRQVLLNILMNAKDAFGEKRREGARIVVRLWQEQGRSVLTVTDNAGGIDGEILDKIFDAYFTTKDLGKGTGLGLFMSKIIIEKNMGGRLAARNIEGGAEFRIEV